MPASSEKWIDAGDFSFYNHYNLYLEDTIMVDQVRAESNGNLHIGLGPLFSIIFTRSIMEGSLS